MRNLARSLTLSVKTARPLCLVYSSVAGATLMKQARKHTVIPEHKEYIKATGSKGSQ